VVEARAVKNHAPQAVSLSHLAAVLEWSDEAIFSQTLDGIVLSWNRGAEKIFGYAGAEIIGQPLATFIPPESPQELPEMLARLRRGDHIIDYETVWQRKDGTRFDILLTISPIVDESHTVVAASVVGHDITQRKRTEEGLQRLNTDLARKAYHDTLTNLPNRMLFADRLRQALARARRTRRQVAILLLDLNHFKQINDMFGHDAGDAVLVEIARRLRTATRETDTVARWGGDEFTVILNDVRKRKGVVQAVDRIMAAFNAPVMLRDRELAVTAAGGIALFPTDAERPDDLMQHADQAMYAAKGQGENICAFFGGVIKKGGKSA
jgi:diguanylate cyclase (GGDEF)-like protein/PAS domain S-box-containing protein